MDDHRAPAAVLTTNGTGHSTLTTPYCNWAARQVFFYPGCEASAHAYVAEHLTNKPYVECLVKPTAQQRASCWCHLVTNDPVNDPVQLYLRALVSSKVLLTQRSREIDITELTKLT